MERSPIRRMALERPTANDKRLGPVAKSIDWAPVCLRPCRSDKTSTLSLRLPHNNVTTPKLSERMRGLHRTTSEEHIDYGTPALCNSWSWCRRYSVQPGSFIILASWCREHQWMQYKCSWPRWLNVTRVRGHEKRKMVAQDEMQTTHVDKICSLWSERAFCTITYTSTTRLDGPLSRWLPEKRSHRRTSTKL